jgi:predicted homoserine dehydrogenase-like protein
MIIVDSALQQRVREDNPIQVALVGAGFSGRTLAYQIITAFPGIRLVAVSNRTVSAARAAYERSGVTDVVDVETPAQLEQAIANRQYAVTNDPSVLWLTEGVDAIIEATGSIEFGAKVVMNAVEHGKHVIMLNVELDATLGPVFKTRADRAGVIVTNTDGDEPGVAMNMARFVRSIGLEPVVAGNLKGLYDRYRTPKTQEAFAKQQKKKATTMTSFADGTKLSMELTVLGNALGFGVGKRGMHGPPLKDVNESKDFYADKLIEGGMVDFLLGAHPGNGAFVVGFSEDPVRKDYLEYLKMGSGPLYVFYTPFHLPQLEIPLTVARAVLLNDATVTPLGAPTCDSIAVAKKELRSGETLDGLGGFTCYALIENFRKSREIKALPMGISEGCVMVRDVAKDEVVTYEDVQLPEGRLCDELREELESMVDGV